MKAKKLKHFNVLEWIRSNALYVVIGVILFSYAASIIYSLVWALGVTLKPYSEFLNTPLKVFPKEFTYKNWVKAINELKIDIDGKPVYIETMFLNSFLYSVGCAFISSTMQCIAAYLTSKYKFKFGKVVYGIVIVTMILPIVGSLPSELQMLNALNLHDTFIGILILKANFLGTYFLVFYAIFKSISWSYAESAFIDGASHFRVMIQIMLPLVKTTFFAVFMLNFIMYWNDYQGPMLYLPSYPTAAFGMYYMKFAATSSFGREHMQLTGCMLMTIPIVIVFVIFQKRLMGNLTIGGIKG